MQRTLSLVSVLCFVSVALPQTPDELVARLKDADAAVRRQAAEALGKQKVEAAIPALAGLLDDQAPEVRRAVGTALGRIGPKAVPAIVQVLPGAGVFGKRAGLETLLGFGPEAGAATPAMTKLLKDEDTWTAIIAAHALGSLGTAGKAALPALQVAAQDTRNTGRGTPKDYTQGLAVAAVRASLRIEPEGRAALAKAILPALTTALESKEIATVQAAAEALRALGAAARPAVPALRAALKVATLDAEYALKRALLDLDPGATLAQVRDPKTPLEERLRLLRELSLNPGSSEELVPLLRGLLEDREPQLRAGAVAALRWNTAAARAALPALVKLLGDQAVAQELQRMERSEEPVLVETIADLGKPAVPALVAVLKDKEQGVFARMMAARGLAKLGRLARPMLADLEAHCEEESIPIALESAHAYLRAGGAVTKVLPVLQLCLKHKVPAVAWNAARVARSVGPVASKLVPELQALLKHTDSEIRIQAAHALSEMGAAARPAVTALAELYVSGDGRQRYQVGQALGRLGAEAKAAVPVLLGQLDKLEKVSPNPIIVLLGTVGPEAKAAVPDLVKLLDGDSIFHSEILVALGRIGPDAVPAVPRLVKLLSDRSEYTRRQAAQALGGIGPKAKEALPALKKLQDDPHERVRVWAVVAVAQINGDAKAALPALLDLWQTAPDARFEVASALAALGRDARAALPILLEAVLDERALPGTRGQAARALGRLADDAEAIVPKLVTLLERPAKEGRRLSNIEYATEALGTLGPAAKAAVPALRKLLDDPQPRVPDRAAQALEKITGER